MDNFIIVTIILSFYCPFSEPNVLVGITIESYSNPNGTCYVEASLVRKCCDGPQRSDCASGDTCDTFFDICVGSMEANWGCRGAFFQTRAVNNSNNFSAPTMMESKSTFWTPGMVIFVFINDDDSDAGGKKHDHIDTLIEELKFDPSPNQATAVPYHLEWTGETSLRISIEAWCDRDYYGTRCGTYCKGIPPMSLCDSTGTLTCQPSEALLLDFKQNATDSDLPNIVLNVNRYVQERVCQDHTAGGSTVNYPSLDVNSNTFTFTANCGDHQVTPVEFESLLKLEKQSTLDSYFSLGLVTGPNFISQGYGEHIIPNVYLSVELLHVDNPLGTSYNGNKLTGERRCCDIPRPDNCAASGDLCDMQVSVCVGEILNDVCIGAVTISPTYTDSTSISTCGSTVLDLTNNVASIAHPMIGGFRLNQNTTTIQVVVKDVDLNGSASDIIDAISKNVTVVPGPNVTYAQSVDIKFTNIASVTLRMIYWCAPGHSGPLCQANNGTDTCQPGWYGNQCEFQLSACSPNPCKHGGKCNLLPNNGYNCTCDAGYTGSSCEQDVDECSLHICQHNATCQNLDGAFNCICPTMWTGLICTDDRVPACDPNPCYHGRCIEQNTPDGNYICQCDKGWTQVNCNVKVECSHDVCVNGDCRSVSGADVCICHAGYNGDSCNNDIDECQAKPCGLNGVCTNTIGNFSCACSVGFSGRLCQDITGACKNVVCQNSGTCVDIDGTNYICMCQDGFTGDMCDSKINNCGNVTCANNGTCYETAFNDFMCNCSQFWSGKICNSDVNECAKSVCKNGGLCKNLPGSFHCDCPDFWTGTDCTQDVDECAGSFVLCEHGNCTNLPGSYTCTCDYGYTGQHCMLPLGACQNVTCSNHGTCIVNDIGYVCNCDPGFTGNDCSSDIDECAQDVCGKNSMNCTNLPGFYKCNCKAGWQGLNCTDDINECSATQVIPCSGNGICINYPGGYSCSCYEGFSGLDCSVFNNICADIPCKHNGSCTLKNKDATCICTPGWTGISCTEDVNECEVRIPCFNSGICENTDGSYYCRCLEGWAGSMCEQDVNECLSPVCQNGGVCTNTQGGYRCSCQTGWVGTSCDIQKIESISGHLLQFVFQQNITTVITQQTISISDTFLAKYLCRGSQVQFVVKSIINNKLQFKATCNDSNITKDQVSSVLLTIPNDTLSHIFPTPLLGVEDVFIPLSVTTPSLTSSTPSTLLTTHPKVSSLEPTPVSQIISSSGTSSSVSTGTGLSSPLMASQKAAAAQSQSWITDHWPVAAGCVGAFVIIVLVLIGGYYKDKRHPQYKPFHNPNYTDELKEFDQ